MQRIRSVLSKAFTPITIMLIPHSNVRPLRFKMPSIGIALSVVFWLLGMAYVFSRAVDTAEHQRTQEKLKYYSQQFLEMRSTVSTLKKAESEFEKLFSYKSREEVLENLDATDRGSLDLEDLKQQIKMSMETVGEIKDYLSQQRSVYLATPKGWPVVGHITSPYGEREHPRTGAPDFHTGIDIAAGPGSPVTATADGVVSFSGWAGNNGNLVVLEHGAGFSTFYAHNRRVAVSVGQKVKRGDIIGYVGSTGNSTGPHVHYEVWREGHSTNPEKFLEGKS